MKSLGQVTLLQYFSSYKRSLGALASLGIVPALFSRLIPEWGSYCFPPLGNQEPVARIGTVALAFLVSCCGYMLINKPYIRRLVWVGVAAITVGLIAYLIASAEYTRRVDIPSSGKAVLVSIGAQRSEFANEKFAGEGDWQMLRDWGLNDEQIVELWTPGSVIRARLSLFVSYLGVVLGWTFCFSAFMALELSSHDHLQRASGKTGDHEN